MILDWDNFLSPRIKEKCFFVDFIFNTAANQSPEKPYQDFIKANEMEHTYRISADDFPMFDFENEIRKRFPEYSAAGN